MHLANLLSRTATLWPDRLAVSDRGREFSWRDTAQRVEALADAIRTACGRPHCAVVILGDSGVEYLELSFAIAMAGQVMVPMNTRLSDSEYEVLLGQLDCPLAFVSGSFVPLVLEPLASAGARIVTWDDTRAAAPINPDYEAFLASGTPRGATPVASEDVWGIIYTGGTTGLPKGVVLSHRAITSDIAVIAQTLPWEEGCRFLQVSPLFHLAGLGPSYAVTALGGTHFFLPQFSVDGLLDKLSALRCTATALVPTMMNWMLAHPQLDHYDLSALRHLGYGASSISPPMLERMLAKFPGMSFTQYYGQTECCGSLTVLTPADHGLDADRIARLASAGRPPLGAHVAIRDADGNEVQRGTWGEICGRSDGLFSGYLGHDELTRQALRDDGWLHTGDVGYMDEDGYVFVTDRLKDMIVTGGENVSSGEVEAVLARMPGVLQCAVIAVKDDDWGERIHACIVTQPDHAIDENAVQAFCRKRIARYKCPRSFTFFSTPLPVSAVGKVRKDMLRQMVGQTAAAPTAPLPAG